MRHIKADPQRIRALAAAGYSQSTIGLMLGVSRERIRQICNRDGIKTLSGLVDWDRREKLCALADQKITAREAAIRAGYAPGSATNAFRAAGIAPPKAETWPDRYLECAEVGMTLSETARHFGHSVQRVWTECHRAGVTFAARHRVKSDRRKWTEAERAEIRARIAAGETLKEIGASYGKAPGAIWLAANYRAKEIAA